MALTEPQRGFVQLLMQRKYISADEGLEAYNEIHLLAAAERHGRPERVGTVESPVLMDKKIGEINKKLDLLSVAISKQFVVHENKQYFAFVNTLADETAKLGSVLTQSEIALFNLISERIIEGSDEQSPSQVGTPSDLTLGFNEVQNLGSEIVHCARLRPLEAKQVIEKLASSGWLRILNSRDSGKRVGFGIRSIIELPEVRELNRSRAMAFSARQNDEPDDAHEDPGDSPSSAVENHAGSTDPSKRVRADEPEAARRPTRRKTRRAVVDEDDDYL